MSETLGDALDRLEAELSALAAESGFLVRILARRRLRHLARFRVTLQERRDEAIAAYFRRRA